MEGTIWDTGGGGYIIEPGEFGGEERESTRARWKKLWYTGPAWPHRADRLPPLPPPPVKFKCDRPRPRNRAKITKSQSRPRSPFANSGKIEFPFVISAKIKDDVRISVSSNVSFHRPTSNVLRKVSHDLCTLTEPQTNCNFF